MNGGVTAPNFVCNCFGDGTAVISDVIETRLATLRLPHSLCSNKSSVSTERQRVMSQTKPMSAEVCHFRHIRKTRVNFSRVIVAVLFREIARPEIRRITDDRVGF